MPKYHFCYVLISILINNKILTKSFLNKRFLNINCVCVCVCVCVFLICWMYSLWGCEKKISIFKYRWLNILRKMILLFYFSIIYHYYKIWTKDKYLSGIGSNIMEKKWFDNSLAINLLLYIWLNSCSPFLWSTDTKLIRCVVSLYSLITGLYRHCKL